MDLFATLGLGDKPSEENAVSVAVFSDDSNQDLEQLRLALMQDMGPFLQEYVWHKDEFDLHCSSSQQPPWAKQRRRQRSATSNQQQQQQQPVLPCLWSITHVGDNIEDEWVVVSLLVQLSRKHPGLSIQVWDNDGEFLLIEAAYALPRWLKPEVAANRVWIRGGTLHLVPQPSAKCPSLPAFPTLAEALQILRQPPAGCATEAPKVAAALRERLGELPSSALALVHVSEARLPLRLAVALRKDPQLIAPAVEAFFYRDGDDMRAAGRMTHFPLRGPQALLLHPCRVRLSRCQHAQLLQQRFAAPRGMPMPDPSSEASEFRAAELGLKITSGFEILWARAARVGKLPEQILQQQQQQPQLGEAGADPLRSYGTGADACPTTGPGGAVPASGPSTADGGPGPAAEAQARLTEQQLQGLPAWEAYVTSLTRSGYFEGNLKGSARYRELMARAVAQFCESPLLPRSTQQLADPVLRALRAVQAAEAEAAQARLAGGLEEWLSAAEERGGPRAREEAGAAAVDPEGLDARLQQELDRELARRQAELEGHASRRQARSAGVAGSSSGPAGADAGGGSGGWGPGEPGEAGAQEQVLEAAELVSKFTKFVSAMSGHEGAELPESERPVALDAQRLLQRLKETLGMAPGAADDEGSDDDGESSSEGSSFFSDEGDDDDDDEDDDEDGDGDGAVRGSAAFMEELERQIREGLWPEPSQRPSRRAPKPSAAAAAAAEKLADSLRQLEVAGVGLRGRADEVETETDSDDASSEDGLSMGSDGPDGSEGEDDEGGAEPGEPGARGFMGAYSRVLEQQLQGTKMAETFERASATAVGAQEAPAGAQSGDALQPVDLDINLVKNLLRSAAAQHGLAGPASNLAGLLGVSLPQGMDEDQVGKL